MLTLTIVGSSVVQSAEKPVRKIQKVVLIALARDGVRAAEIEAGVKHKLSEHGVVSESLRILANDKAITVQELSENLKSQGYDSVFCMSPRKTIHIAPTDQVGKAASVVNCLNSYLTGNSPSGEPLEVDPVISEVAPGMDAGKPGSSRSPIPSNPAAAPFSVYKGTLQFFDTSTGSLLWEGLVQVKVPADMRGSIQTKVVSYEINKVLQKSGLLPK